MSFVVGGQNVGVRSGVGYRRIERRFGHETAYVPSRIIVPRHNTGAPLTIAILVIFRQQPVGCARQCVRPPRERARARTGLESLSTTPSDCRGYSVVKCTTRRSPLVHEHTRGLRSQSTEGSACVRLISGSIGL